MLYRSSSSGSSQLSAVLYKAASTREWLGTLIVMERLCCRHLQESENQQYLGRKVAG